MRGFFLGCLSLVPEGVLRVHDDGAHRVAIDACAAKVRVLVNTERIQLHLVVEEFVTEVMD